MTSAGGDHILYSQHNAHATNGITKCRGSLNLPLNLQNTIQIIIVIAFKDAIRDFLLSPNCARTISNTYAQVARAQLCANHVLAGTWNSQSNIKEWKQCKKSNELAWYSWLFTSSLQTTFMFLTWWQDINQHHFRIIRFTSVLTNQIYISSDKSGLQTEYPWKAWKFLFHKHNTKHKCDLPPRNES